MTHKEKKIVKWIIVAMLTMLGIALTLSMGGCMTGPNVSGKIGGEVEFDNTEINDLEPLEEEEDKNATLNN